MRIKNNPRIFYLACGLLAEGDKRYDHNDSEIAALAKKIQKASQEVSLDADIIQWFNLAKTGQVDANPYWPRGHAMLMAVVFTEEGTDLDIDQFIEFLESINMQDPIGPEEFREWIGRLPEILTYAETLFRTFWKEYCEIMFARTSSWMPQIEASRLPLKEFFGKSAPNLVLAPNLFASPFAADFVRIPNDDTVTMIACKPDVESMLHEALHSEIAKYRDKIIAFGEEHSLAAFADAEKMQELGYMQTVDDDPAYTSHIIEECFVRALSATLAGGGEGRLQSHINCGFTGLPTIADYFEEHRPKAANLGDFIDTTLKGMTATQ